MKKFLTLFAAIFLIAASVLPANAWYRSGPSGQGWHGGGWNGGYRPSYWRYGGYGYRGYNNNWGAAAGIGLGLGLLGGALAAQQYYNNYNICVDPYGVRYYC